MSEGYASYSKQVTLEAFGPDVSALETQSQHSSILLLSIFGIVLADCVANLLARPSLSSLILTTLPDGSSDVSQLALGSLIILLQLLVALIVLRKVSFTPWRFRLRRAFIANLPFRRIGNPQAQPSGQFLSMIVMLSIAAACFASLGTILKSQISDPVQLTISILVSVCLAYGLTALLRALFEITKDYPTVVIGILAGAFVMFVSSEILHSTVVGSSPSANSTQFFFAMDSMLLLRFFDLVLAVGLLFALLPHRAALFYTITSVDQNSLVFCPFDVSDPERKKRIPPIDVALAKSHFENEKAILLKKDNATTQYEVCDPYEPFTVTDGFFSLILLRKFEKNVAQQVPIQRKSGEGVFAFAGTLSSVALESHLKVGTTLDSSIVDTVVQSLITTDNPNTYLRETIDLFLDDYGSRLTKLTMKSSNITGGESVGSLDSQDELTMQVSESDNGRLSELHLDWLKASNRYQSKLQDMQGEYFTRTAFVTIGDLDNASNAISKFSRELAQLELQLEKLAEQWRPFQRAQALAKRSVIDNFEERLTDKYLSRMHIGHESTVKSNDIDSARSLRLLLKSLGIRVDGEVVFAPGPAEECANFYRRVTDEMQELRRAASQKIEDRITFLEEKKKSLELTDIDVNLKKLQILADLTREAIKNPNPNSRDAAKYLIDMWTPEEVTKQHARIAALPDDTRSIALQELNSKALSGYSVSRAKSEQAILGMAAGCLGADLKAQDIVKIRKVLELFSAEALDDLYGQLRNMTQEELWLQFQALLDSDGKVDDTSGA